MPRDYTIIPEDAEIDWLAEWLWHDPSDRRYMLEGPNACTEEEYYTSVAAADYYDSLIENGGGSAADLPPEIAEEIRNEVEIDKREGRA